jgi:hypothetical protein
MKKEDETSSKDDSIKISNIIIMEIQKKKSFIGSLDPIVFNYEFIFQNTHAQSKEEKKNDTDNTIGRIYIRNLHIKTMEFITVSYKRQKKKKTNK